MHLLRSKPAAAMLIATTIPVPLLIGAAEAAGATHAHDASAATHAHDASAATHAHDASAAQHSEATRHARALRRLEAAQRAKLDGARRHRKSRAEHARRADARTVKSKSWRLVFPHARKAHAASDPADTISDFKFTPGTLTIHVGDTVTWTNDGPTDHTATANDGSFNTGTLKKGRSASHTFTKAGTFAYICAIHPFMKGTIVVQASTASTTTPTTTSPSSSSNGSGSGGSSGSSGGSSGSGSSGSGSGSSSGSGGSGSGSGSSSSGSGSSSSGSGSSSSGSGSSGGSGSGTSGSTTTPSTSTSGTTTSDTDTASTSASTLPETGLDLVASLLLGLALIAGGVGLRTRVRRVSEAEPAQVPAADQ
jgi:plastocyanin